MIVSTVTGKAYEGVKHSVGQKLTELLGKHTFVELILAQWQSASLSNWKLLVQVQHMFKAKDFPRPGLKMS